VILLLLFTVTCY